MHDLVVYGAGGLGREVGEMVRRINERHRFWRLLGFVDDGGASGGLGGSEFLGGLEFIKGFNGPLDVAIAIANPAAKRRLYETLKRDCPNVTFPNVIDTGARLSSRVSLDEGVIISHFCSVSVEVRLGRCVFLNTGTHVGHDTTIGDFSSVMPNVDISGNVTVGSDALIGVNSAILQGVAVGSGATVGMGAIVMTPVPEGYTVLGNPARKF